METKETFREFKSELRGNIIKTIRSLRNIGTTGMSERNLLAVTPTPRCGGPIGSNVVWAYKGIFHEVLSSMKTGFVIKERA